MAGPETARSGASALRRCCEGVGAGGGTALRRGLLDDRPGSGGWIPNGRGHRPREILEPMTGQSTDSNAPGP